MVAVAALGPSTVEAFGGLTLAIAVAACLAPLALLDELGGWRRLGGALCVGFAYLVAAYLVQGAFKETMQALFVLAFAIAPAAARARPATGGERRGPLRAVPLAVLAIGSVYAYSFPGLAWLGGGARGLGRDRARPGGGRRAAPARPSRARAQALPARGRARGPRRRDRPRARADGRLRRASRPSTPPAPGLGNLFDRLSPLEALGIWPSGDFRVEPGDGAVPALVFYLGAALRGRGARLRPRLVVARAATARVPAALRGRGAAVAVLAGRRDAVPGGEGAGAAGAAGRPDLGPGAGQRPRRRVAAVAFLAAAGGSSVLALANGPVGPERLLARAGRAARRARPAARCTSSRRRELLDEQHGRDYLVWELRGNRVCVEPPRRRAAAPGGHDRRRRHRRRRRGDRRRRRGRRPRAPRRAVCPFDRRRRPRRPGAAGG